MKSKLNTLARRYQTALHKQLQQSPGASLQPARALGRRAAAIGLETVDVARMHATALAALETGSSRDGMIKRAELFFAEAITPIEMTHGAARKATAHLHQLHTTLDRRAIKLAASNRNLKRGIVRRKTVELALKKSAEHSAQLMLESRRLQNHLRQLTHQILSAQEDERTKVSRELHDEIAQTLLGINIRLLALKQTTTANTAGLKKEIASTHRLVKDSVKTMNRFAREFGKQHAT